MTRDKLAMYVNYLCGKKGELAYSTVAMHKWWAEMIPGLDKKKVI